MMNTRKKQLTNKLSIMKTIFNSVKSSLCALTLAVVLLASTSCEKVNPEIITESDLSGEITENKTLEAKKSYTLSGGLHIKNGATLTIGEGVTISAVDDDIVDYILVEQGAKIIAKGTASSPIIMTSEKKEPGAWGGLHICGLAPINVTGTTSKSEIGDAVYGGSNASDNSGIYQYIRLEYTGYAFSEEKESNGVTFYGVGKGTTVDHLQAYMGSDDGFEWFGGNVNVKYMISTNCSDDSFDWTEGWSGKGQFILAIQGEESSLGYECDCLIEADNNSKDAVASPVSHPVLANLTLVGNNSTVNKRGIRLRAGTQVEIYNTLVKGKPQCITTETSETETSLKEGVSVLEYISSESTIDCKEGIYSESLFITGTNNLINQNITLSSGYAGTIEGGKNLTAIDSFFTSAAYRGAVGDDDWTKGWSK